MGQLALIKHQLKVRLIWAGFLGLWARVKPIFWPDSKMVCTRGFYTLNARLADKYLAVRHTGILRMGLGLVITFRSEV